jgi:hypothetical protein
MVVVPYHSVAVYLSPVARQRKCGRMPEVERCGTKVCTPAAVIPDQLPQVVYERGTPAINTGNTTHPCVFISTTLYVLIMFYA